MEKKDVQKVVEEIDTRLRKELWFDFEVTQYRKNKLTIIGTLDSSGQHKIEICFEDVFFVSLPIGWQTDTSKPVLVLVEGDDAFTLNKRFQVEIGYHIFRFTPEYYPEDFACYVAAKHISFKDIA